MLVENLFMLEPEETRIGFSRESRFYSWRESMGRGEGGAQKLERGKQRIQDDQFILTQAVS